VSAGDREPVWAVSIRVLDVAVRVLTRLDVQGLAHLPASGPALVVANHVSYLDPVVLVVLAHRRGRKLRFLGVAEAFRRPVTGWFLRAGRHIPIGADGERTVALRSAREALQRGELVLIYPEGTIPGRQPVREAQGGAGLLALTTGVPVVPVVTGGLERRAGSLRLRRPACAVVGPPVDLSAAQDLRGRARYLAASELMLTAIRGLATATPGAPSGR